LYFLPVGIGGVIGFIVFAKGLNVLFDSLEPQLRWFFVGCIIGIFPALFKQAGKKGRKKLHWGIMAVSLAAGLVFLWGTEYLLDGGSVPLNFGTWIMAGAIFALGFIVPGLSPSNILVFLGMYEPMTGGIGNLPSDIIAFVTGSAPGGRWNLDIFRVVLPVGIGAVLAMLLFSKLIEFIFKKAYAGLFHVILGVVLASTLMIIPPEANYLSLGALSYAAACVIGIILGAWMSKLEKDYKPEE